ncbi:MAG: 4Fe-4S binding protein, partial [Proteobacteria bacterium]|nr:4Fe-4S binding protein [Pseudomonadota bacterium]
MLRKIIEIDEEKCTGCGLCVPGCAEGALQIINGKARLVKETYCDGLGACLGECPEGALKIVEREAEPFNEEEVHKHLEEMKKMSIKDELPCGCPGSSVRNFEHCSAPETEDNDDTVLRSELSHWPVQLT